MKKLLTICLVTTFIILANQNIYAQEGWGVEAGANIANINGIDFDTETRAGILAGVYYKLLLTGTSLYLQPEMMYSQKGWKEGDIKYRLSYLSANVLLAYYFTMQGPINPFIKAGPSLGINTTAKVEFDGDEQDLDDIKSTDFGVIARAGVQVNRIEVGARLAQGLSNIVDNADSDAKNFLFGFFIGVNL